MLSRFQTTLDAHGKRNPTRNETREVRIPGASYSPAQWIVSVALNVLAHDFCNKWKKYDMWRSENEFNRKSHQNIKVVERSFQRWCLDDVAT